MFEGIERRCEQIFYILGIEYNDLDEVPEVVSGRRMAMRTDYLPIRRLKIRLFFMSMQRYFCLSKGHANTFIASWAYKKSKSRK
jgi:hypothetical protein